MYMFNNINVYLKKKTKEKINKTTCARRCLPYWKVL